MAGRSAEFSEILARLGAHNGSVAIIGVPRIGKTSLIKEIYAQLKKADGEFSRIWIDLSTLADLLTFFRTINDEFVAEAAERGSKKAMI